MWFYKIERDEKNKYINITWNTTMTYIKSILGVVGVGACLFNLVWLAAICLTILAVALTYYLYRYGNLVRILHSHEQKKGLEYTGSQYSFKDPLIVTIPGEKYMNRQENLIQILLKAEKPLTTQELAEQLNVSSRTIRSDLEKNRIRNPRFIP